MNNSISKSIQFTCVMNSVTVTIYRYDKLGNMRCHHEYKVSCMSEQTRMHIERISRKADYHFIHVFTTMLMISYYFINKAGAK